MEEIWKDIEGFEDYYQVSSYGRVKSCVRCICTGGRTNHETANLKERILKCSNADVYYSVVLCKDGKKSFKTVHRLVAQAFIPNPDNLPCVNHKDCNPKNNHVDNLEWCTYKYNNEYNDRINKCKDRISKTLKEKQYHHKMTPEQIERIRQGAYKGWKARRAKMQKNT